MEQLKLKMEQLKLKMEQLKPKLEQFEDEKVFNVHMLYLKIKFEG
jgi:hypothetical protein